MDSGSWFQILEEVSFHIDVYEKGADRLLDRYCVQ